MENLADISEANVPLDIYLPEISAKFFILAFRRNICLLDTWHIELLTLMSLINGYQLISCIILLIVHSICMRTINKYISPAHQCDIHEVYM